MYADSLSFTTVPALMVAALLAYIAAEQLITRLSGRTTRWIAGFAGAGVVFCVARVVQHVTLSAEIVSFASRMQTVSGVFMAAFALEIARAKKGSPASTRAVWVAAGALALIVVFTPWIYAAEVTTRFDFAGRPYVDPKPGPLSFLLAVYAVLALVIAVRVVVVGEPLLNGALRPVMRILIVFAGACAINDALDTMHVIDSIELLEVGIALMAIVLVVVDRVQLRELADEHGRTVNELAEQRARLDSAQTRLTVLVGASMEGLVMHADGEVLEVNEAMAALRGEPQESIVGRRVEELFEMRDDDLEALLHSSSDGPIQAFINTQHGEVDVLLSWQTAIYKARAIGVIAVRDVTENSERRARLSVANEITAARSATNEQCVSTELNASCDAGEARALGTVSSSVSSVQRTPRFRAGRILMVEDEPLVARALKRAIGRHEVVVVGSGFDAITRLEAETFDLVLCDLGLPDIDGIEVFHLAQEVKPELAARFIFMSGGPSSRQKRDLDALSNLHIDKPIDLDVLRTIVDQMLATNAQSSGLRAK